MHKRLVFSKTQNFNPTNSVGLIDDSNDSMVIWHNVAMWRCCTDANCGGKV